MQTYTLPALGAIFVTILLLLGITSFVENRTEKPDANTPDEKPNEEENTADTLPYGSVTLRVGERATFADVSIRPLQIVEESRCPGDVVCIQAGTVRVLVETVSAMGTSTDTITLGGLITTEAEKVEFVSASPYPITSRSIAASEYELTFNVTKRAAEMINPPLAPCYVGGCSGQLCTDDPNAVSTCEYREEYACYQSATCERQGSGRCGWTLTPALEACLVGS